MMWIFYLLAIFIAVEFYLYYFLRGKTGGIRLVALFILGAIAIFCPFIIPAAFRPLRFIVAMIMMVKIFKAVEIAYGRESDPSMLQSFLRFLFWTSIPPDTTWPQNKEVTAQTRKEGGKRILRGALKSLLVMGLIAVSGAYPQMHSYYALKMLWTAFLIYFLITGFIDIGAGILMQTGIFIEESFCAPLIARSPRDFWSRRWNIYFRTASHRNIFLPLGGAKRSLLGVIVVFLFSAILHEYLIWIAIGHKMLGYMSAFFMLHCAATIVQTKFGHSINKKEIMPRALAVLLHFIWFLATIPLFLEPLIPIFDAHKWHF